MEHSHGVPLERLRSLINELNEWVAPINSQKGAPAVCRLYGQPDDIAPNFNRTFDGLDRETNFANPGGLRLAPWLPAIYLIVAHDYPRPPGDTLESISDFNPQEIASRKPSSPSV
jgi:hypothetical protein